MNRRTFNLAAILSFLGLTSVVKARTNFPVAKFLDGKFINGEELTENAKWVLKQPQPHIILEKEVEVLIRKEDAIVFHIFGDGSTLASSKIKIVWGKVTLTKRLEYFLVKSQNLKTYVYGSFCFNATEDSQFEYINQNNYSIGFDVAESMFKKALAQTGETL